MRMVKMAVMAAFFLSLGIFLLAQVREIQQKDRTKPVIESDKKVLKVPCDYTKKQLLKGLKAFDAKDGDLTSQILVGDITRFIEKGMSEITYVVFDSGNQPASLTRRIEFSDYHSPRFQLSEPLVFSEGEGNYEELRSRIRAKDMLDGNRTEWMVQKESNINYQKAGEYSISYEVTNSYGDSTTMQFPVHILKSGNQSLEIRLTKAIVYLEPGESTDPNQWLEGVYDSQGEPMDPAMVSTAGNVEPDTPGVYEIRYRADDGRGKKGETWLTVVVQE